MGEAFITRRGGGGGEPMFTNYSNTFDWYHEDHSAGEFGYVNRGQPETITASIARAGLTASDAVKEGIIVSTNNVPVIPFKAGETLSINCACDGNYYEIKTSVSNSTGNWLVTAEVNMLSTSADDMAYFDIGYIHGTIE